MSVFTRDDAMLVRDHLRWMELLGRSEATVYARSRSLIRLARSIRPVRISHAGVNELYGWREGLEVSDGSIASYVAHVREFYNWLVTEGYRDDNPALVLPVPARGRSLPRPVSTEDLAYAVAAAPDRIRPWLVLAAWCGLRAKEVALLRRENVLETADPPVLIVAIDATKGRRTERVIPLHPFALAELRALPLPRSGWVFPRHDGRPGPNRAWLVSHMANDHLHSLGITASFHQLRHWFGTETYRASRDLRVVQELLGHSSPQTTAGYAAVTRAGAADAVSGLPDVRAPLTIVKGKP